MILSLETRKFGIEALRSCFSKMDKLFTSLLALAPSRHSTFTREELFFEMFLTELGKAERKILPIRIGCLETLGFLDTTTTKYGPLLWTE